MALVSIQAVVLCLTIFAERVSSSDLDALSGLSVELKGGSSAWNTSDTNPCKWEGVQCEGVSIVNITLQGMLLKGTISEGIGQLRSLRILDLSKNYLHDGLPASLFNCSALSTLNLSANRLSGGIPADFSKLSSLQQLDLAANALSGSIPEQLGNLSLLTSLNLAYNSLTGSMPVGFGYLKSLQFLSLSQNSLEGLIPESFVNLTRLQTLSAYQNNLTGHLPPLSWESLEFVNLASNNLSGVIPENICMSGALQGLVLSYNSFEGPFPASLGSCHALVTLRVGHNLLTGELPTAVGDLQSLVYLEASRNLLTGSIPAGISGCKSLALLNLEDNRLGGSIPEDIGSVATLQELHLEKNGFVGVIPHGLLQCKLLSVLDISDNNLSGGIPADVCSVNRLVYLRLQGNSLAGNIPPSIGDCQELLELQLSDNNLSGAIPSTIGQLLNLQVSLNLSANHLTGSIPDSIGMLSKLVSLDLSHNLLTGRIPSLINMVSLLTWNFSYNMLSGPIPQVGSVLNSSSSDYASSYAHNDGLCGGPLATCLASGLKAKSKVISFWQAAGISVSSVIVVLLIFSCMAWAIMQKNQVSASVDPAPSEMVSQVFVPHLAHMVNFESVKEAVQSKGNLISSNHFSTMYKAIQPSGLVLAAKRFQSAEKGLVLHYKKMVLDLDKIWKLSHENVMQPIGYLVQENLAVLVYDFVPMCSLGQQLHKDLEHASIAWAVRYQIAIGAAQGLVFLHHSCHPPMVHMDVNSYNIFLGQHSEVKVGDIEVAKLLDPAKVTASVSAVAGSVGYIAPEYAFTMQVTLESNVYSFGVILLELLTGKLPIEDTYGDGIDLVRWVHGAPARGETPEQILDARISTQSFAVRQEMLAVLKVALLCTDASPSKRPHMKKVLELLLNSKMKPAAAHSTTR